ALRRFFGGARMPKCNPSCCECEGNDAEENESPRGSVDEPASGERAQCRGCSGPGRPLSDCRSARLSVKRRLEQCQAVGNDKGARASLYHPRGDEESDVRCESAADRAHGESDEPKSKNAGA